MNELDLLDFTWKAIILGSFATAVIQLFISAPYGRYSRGGYGFSINARLAWVVQECPSFVVPVFVAGCLRADQIKGELNPNVVLLSMFLLHYFQRYNSFTKLMFIVYDYRTFIYSFLIQGGKPTPFIIFLMAMSFCTLNGYMQSRYLLHYYAYSDSWFYDPRFLAGVVIFLLGMAINIQSDAILRGLRRQNETGYKIPRGILSIGCITCSCK